MSDAADSFPNLVTNRKSVIVMLGSGIRIVVSPHLLVSSNYKHEGDGINGH